MKTFICLLLLFLMILFIFAWIICEVGKRNAKMNLDYLDFVITNSTLDQVSYNNIRGMFLDAYKEGIDLERIDKLYLKFSSKFYEFNI